MCEACKQSVILTTASRPEDPNHHKLVCYAPKPAES
jgi:hypothetical protein